jgi:hypothetical protein
MINSEAYWLMVLYALMLACALLYALWEDEDGE